jgi:LPS-assembly lipoprotein
MMENRKMRIPHPARNDQAFLMLKWIVIFVSVILLSACGFHLRGSMGDYKFPFKSVYLDCGGVVICNNLQNTIKTQNLSILATNPQSAEVTIKLINEQTSRDPQGFNSAGRVAAFLLSYQVTAQIWKKGEPIGSDLTSVSQSVMQYNDSTILANNQNEVVFWDQLHQNVVNQLIRRITFFNTNESQQNDSKSK